MKLQQRRHLAPAVLLVLVGFVLVGCAHSTTSDDLQTLAKVKVDRVRRQGVARRVALVGTVTPIDTSIVAAETSGVVRAYPNREGDYIRQGEALAELADATLLIELERAKALFRQEQEKFRELETGYRPEEISQAEAAMKAAEAAIHLAEAQEARLKDLEEKSIGAITEQDMDQARFETEKARQDFIAAKADYELKVGGYREEVIAAAKASMDAAEQEVRRLEDEIRKHTVPAPFDGFLVVEHTDVGQWVDVGGPVATLARLDEVEIRVQVEESTIHLVRADDVVEVRIDALPGETFDGKVTAIVPRADWQQGSRSFPVVVRVENRSDDGQPLLKEGMVARLSFVGKPEDSLMVHKDSIVRSTGVPTVFVVDDKGIVRLVPVVEGPSQGVYVAVEGELSDGDLVVTEGVERLRAFDRVAILNDDSLSDAEFVADDSASAEPSSEIQDPTAPAQGNGLPGGQ